MRKKPLIVALVAALAVTGIAFAAASLFFGPSEDKAISLVPSDAFAYGYLFVRPSNGQKMAIEDILEAAGQTPDEVQDSLLELLDRGLEECDATFEDDVDPWLGGQVAFFFTAPDEVTEDPDGAALVATRDQGGAEDFLAKCREVLDVGEERAAKTYKGFDYQVYENEEMAVGFVEGFLVAGTENGFKATVDVAGGEESLASSDRFKEMTAKVNDDNLALIYLNLRPAVEAARQLEEIAPEEEQVLDLFGDSFDKPYATTFFATSEGFVIESANPWPSDGPLGPVLEIVERKTGLDELPADSWFAIGFPDVGGLAGVIYETALEFEPEEAQAAIGRFEAESGLDFQDDIVDGLGNVRLFVSNGIGPSTRGALVVQTSDEDTSVELLGAVRRALESDPSLASAIRPLSLEGHDQGFTVSAPGAPDVFHVVVAGSRIVGGFGDGATLDALDGDEPLESSEVFRNARELLGDGYEPYLFLDLNVVVDAFEAFVAPSIPNYPEEEVEPIIDAITHLTVGAKRDGDYILERVVIGAEQGD